MNNVHDIERDKFEAAMVKAGFGAADFIKQCREGDGYREGLYSAAYVGWMAAKLDAKPVADIFKAQCFGHNKFTYAGGRGTFATRELAEADAIANGYRLR